MLDKTNLGTRYTCFKCGTKFYDLNRAEPTCPDCEADQREAPTIDFKAMLAANRASHPKYEEEEEEPAEVETDENGDFDDDDDDDDSGDDDDDDDGMMGDMG